MVDLYDNKSNECDIKYYHEQEVTIIKGFYRGNQGTITGYIVKDKKVYYNVNIDKLNTVLLVEESDLQEIKNKKFLSSIFNRK